MFAWDINEAAVLLCQLWILLVAGGGCHQVAILLNLGGSDNKNNLCICHGHIRVTTPITTGPGAIKVRK